MYHPKGRHNAPVEKTPPDSAPNPKANRERGLIMSPEEEAKKGPLSLAANTKTQEALLTIPSNVVSLFEDASPSCRHHRNSTATVTRYVCTKKGIPPGKVWTLLDFLSLFLSLEVLEGAFWDYITVHNNRL
ncbi:hypothetical protein CEXT_502251 [Caerostris extrusa]|uniref:Uncharacterized protein n=1 Tax=Caerostris extrusa TaxID=172846 RepID=A0AAV4U904_CAEEX|nr:hypothetical protein CEXT_502251 [Caerostris extrusa]